MSLQSKKEGKDQESTQSSTTSDPGYQWVSENFTRFMTALFCSCAWSMAIIENVFSRLRMEKTTCCILYIHQDVFVPRQACYADGLVDIEHNLYDRGRINRE